MERFIKAKEVLVCSWRDSCHSLGRMVDRLVGIPRISCLILSSIGLIGCTTLKKASIVSLGAGAGAIAGTVLSGGVAAPILGATTTAFVADAVTEATSIGSGNMSECVTGFWPLVGLVIEAGGWLLAGVILIPLIMGFLIPNGLERKKKKR